MKLAAASSLPPYAADPVLASALREALSRHPAAKAAEATLAAERARADAQAQPLYNPDVELGCDDDGDRVAIAGPSWTLEVSGKSDARTADGSAEIGLVQAQALFRRTGFARQWLLGWAGHRAASRKLA